MTTDYLRDANAIYERSFALVRAEADLDRFPDDVAGVVVRMIHACGMPGIAADVAWTDGVVESARKALHDGAPILCDANMVAAGVTRSRLPAGNAVVCTLGDPSVSGLAAELGTTRSAAALELWRDRMSGAVAVIGNAPTALYRLLEIIAEGTPPPAAIVGVPVGFVGAAESKRALVDAAPAPFLVLHGRCGGSAIAAAAVNAIASASE